MTKKRDESAAASGGSSQPPRNQPFARLRELVGKDLPSRPQSQPEPRSQPQPAREGVSNAAASRERIAGRVVVRRERTGRGGKAVTIVEGDGLHGRDLQELAKSASRALGTGARVEDGAIVVQGDQPERVERWLDSMGFAAITRGN